MNQNDALALAITTLVYFGLGVFVFSRAKRTFAHILFSLLSIAAAMWTIGVYFLYHSYDVPQVLFWYNYIFCMALILVHVIFYFIFYFPRPYWSFKWYFHAGLLLLVSLNLYMILSGNVIQDTAPPPNFNTVWGKGLLLYLFTAVIYIFSSVVVMGYKWVKLRGVQRIQVGYTMAGIFSSAFLVLIFCLVFPAVFKIYTIAQFGPTFGLIMPVAIIYSILKHRLMDIYLVIRRSMIYSLLVIAVITIYGVVILASQLVFRQQGGGYPISSIVLASFFIALGIKPLENFFAKITNRIFFKAHPDYQKILPELSKSISATISINRLREVIAQNIINGVKVKEAKLFVWDQSTDAFIAVSEAGEEQQVLGRQNALIKELSRREEPLVLEELERIYGYAEDEKKKQPIIRDLIAGMYNIQSAVALPLISRERFIGILSVGAKRSEDIFFDEDLVFLKALAQHVSLAVENINLVEEEKTMAQHVAVLREQEKYVGILKEKNNELQQAYNQLKETQHHLVQSEKMATVGTLAGGVAHEINTPLGTILNNAQLLLKEEIDPSQRNSLEFIEKSALQCKTIVQHLLKYARKSKVETQELDLNKVIDDSCVLLEHQLSDDGITLERQYEKTVPVEANENELMQVVTNLLMNARDAVKDARAGGKIDNRIIIRTYQDQSRVVMEIIDKGCGIRQEDFPKIFDPFFTTKDIGKGTGLGLYIVQQIVERHQGQIKIDSVIGAGTTVVVSLPCKQVVA